MTDTYRKRLGTMLSLLCIAIWGVNAVALKVAARPPSGPPLDAVFLSGLRFLACGPVFLLALAVTDREKLRLTRREAGVYALFGLVSVLVGEALMALAVRYTSVANLTLLSHGTISLCTALWAWALFGQPLSRRALGGAGVALFGVALIALHAPGGLRLGGETWRGDALALLRSALHGGYLLIMGRWLRGRSVLQVTGWSVSFGALWCLPYVIWKGATFPWHAVAPQVWLALAWSIIPTTLFGFLAWNWSTAQVGPLAAVNVMYLLPPAAAFAAWGLRGEPVTLWHAVGGLLIVAGIVLVRWEAFRIDPNDILTRKTSHAQEP